MEKNNTTILLLLIASTLFVNIGVWGSIVAETPPGVLTVAFFDVGQGDSIFIEAPDGNQMLVDAGRNGKVMIDLARVLPFFDRSIDIVVPTHPDADHISGFFDVLARYRVSLALYSGAHANTDLDEQLHAALLKNNVSMHKAKIGTIIDLGGGVRFAVISPAFNTSHMKTNNASIVGKLTYGDTSFLLTGDAPSAVEKYLVRRFGKQLRSDILKAGHHGSKYSSSAIFLQTVDPEYTIISVGAENNYGHPSPATLDRVRAEGSKVLSTAKQGTIIFQSDGEKIYLLASS